MLHIENEYIREHLLDGAFGIEMESLRVVGDGMLSQTAHPFPGDAHIVRDFSENQTEINTGVNESIEAAIEELERHTRRIQEKYRRMAGRSAGYQHGTWTDNRLSGGRWG